ncbi:MAG: hypothetical protein EOO01_41600 [Chitinophagaceae bacterium]|nr:MAG: hypothetical protein EOO01_41600 [Chitinophagaceae bacterium]
MMKALKALIVPLWLITLAAVACMKKGVEDIPHPPMQYMYLQNLEIGANEYYHLDVDANGTPDFTFHTLLVGDPVLKQDRRQFLVGSKVETNLLNNPSDESPKLNKGDRIRLRESGYEWYEVSSIVLVEKVTSLHGKISWRGLWKEAAHHYLPLQVEKNGQVFLGWVEVSFNTATQKLILHKAAISTEGGKEIRAGY